MTMNEQEIDALISEAQETAEAEREALGDDAYVGGLLDRLVDALEALKPGADESPTERETPADDWEYGVTSKWGTRAVSDAVKAAQDASALRREIEMGHSSGDLAYHGLVVRRRASIPAGPWEVVTDD